MHVYLFQISFQLFNTSVYFDIVAFVKSDHPKQFPGLTVRYVRGADPIIKLLDESKNVVETLGIDKWNTDSVEAFFDERLKK